MRRIAFRKRSRRARIPCAGFRAGKSTAWSIANRGTRRRVLTRIGAGWPNTLEVACRASGDRRSDLAARWTTSS